MEPNDFLIELQSTIGGDINAETFNYSSPPRLNALYRDVFVKVDFITGVFNVSDFGNKCA